MSKLKKYCMQILCVAGFLLLAVVFAFNPILSVRAADYTTQELDNAVSSVHMPTTLVDLSDDSKDNDKLIVPLLKFSTTTGASVKKYTIRVTDPSGRPLDCAIDTESKTDTADFKYVQLVEEKDAIEISSLTNGNYSITYIYQDSSNKTHYSYPYSVQVKGVDYELTYVEPSDIVDGEETNKLAGTKILLPENAGDNQEIIIPDVYVKIKGSDEYLKAEGNYVLADVTIKKDRGIIYSSTKKENGEVVKIEEAGSKYNGKLKLTTNLGSEESVTYDIIYSYPHGNNMPTDPKRINVTKDYKAPTTLTINSTDFPKMQLGQKGVTLPEWTASTESASKVDTNITKIVIEKEDNSNIKLELTNNNRTFDFTKEAFKAQTYKEMVGNYNITYYMESAYGDIDNKLSASEKKTVIGITDETVPDVYMAYSYDLENGAWEVVTEEQAENKGLSVLKPVDDGKPVTVVTKEDKDGNKVPDVNTDYAVELKANYGYGELVFPAIYAEDLVNSYDEFVFYRYFVYNNDYNEKYYIDNIMLDDDTNTFVPVSSTSKGYNASGDSNIGQFNRVVRFKFNASETNGIENFTNREYTLHYYVVNKDDANRIKLQENNVYETGKTSYKFKVLNRVSVGDSGNNEGVSTPTIKIKDLTNNSSINKDEKLSISVETEDELDKRLKNAVFYYTGESKDADTIKTALENAIEQLLLDETWGQYTEQGGLGEDTLTKAGDYFTKLKCNVLYNDDAENGIIAQLKSTYTGLTRFDVVDNENFETQLKLTSGDTLNIFAVTINDNNTIAVATKTLKVNNTEETKAPLASDQKDVTLQEHVQGDTVTLPTVTFKDEEDDSLWTNVKYYILTAEDDASLKLEDGKVIPDVTYNTPKGVKTVAGKSNDVVISNGTIVANKVGTYYVIYTARDDAGNQTFVTYSFEVKEKVVEKLSVTVKGADIEQSGNKITAKTNTVITFEPTVLKGKEDITDQFTYSCESLGKKYGYTASQAGSSNAWLFEEEDEYVVTIVATSKDGEPKELKSGTFYVEITKPESVTWDYDIEVQSTADVGETIILPNLTASYGNSKLPVPVKVTVTFNNGQKLEYGDVKRNEDGYWYFKCNDKQEDSTCETKGTYTVTYTASWNGCDADPKSFDIKVGDSLPPEFRFANDVSGLSQDLVYDGTHDIEYTIELNRYATNEKPVKKLIIKVNNGKQVYEIDTGLNIVDKDGTFTDGVATSKPFTNWTNLKVELKTTDGKLEEVTKGEDDTFEKKYKISGVGKYTLVLTMSDNYNNQSSPKEFSFNVVAKSQPKQNNDTVVGIVLIVISLVVLAGVILFFAFTGKKGGSNKTKSTKSKKQAETSVESDSDVKSGDVE